MAKIEDDNGDEFAFKDGQWFWIDLDDVLVGPFSTKEKARKNAHDNHWLADGSVAFRAAILRGSL